MKMSELSNLYISFELDEDDSKHLNTQIQKQ